MQTEKENELQLLLSEKAVSTLPGKTQRNTLYDFNTNTVDNEISSSYFHVDVKFPYKFRETIHDRLSDSQVYQPRKRLCLGFLQATE